MIYDEAHIYIHGHIYIKKERRKEGKTDRKLFFSHPGEYLVKVVPDARLHLDPFDRLRRIVLINDSHHTLSDVRGRLFGSNLSRQSNETKERV